MAVYVDDGFVEGDWGFWTGGGHMQADTLEELHEIADRMRLRREWFQSKPGKPWHDHYDLTAARREQAIALGALPVTWREAARRNRVWRAAFLGRDNRAMARPEYIEIEPVDGWKGRAVHGERMTIVTYAIDSGAPDVHEHHHPEEEAWTVIEGELLVWVEGEERTLGPGDVAVIAPNARHRVRALRATRAMVVDSPARRELPGSSH